MHQLSTEKQFENVLTGLAIYLCRDGLISYSEAIEMQQAAFNAKLSFTQYLIASHFWDSEQLLSYCVKTFKLPVFQFDKNPLALDDLLSLNSDILEQHRILPLYRDQKYLYVGMSDPTDHVALNTIQFHTQLRVRVMLIAEDILSSYLLTYTTRALHDQAASAISKLSTEDIEIESIPEDIDEPVIVFVDQLLQDAIKNKISDIHVEPYTDTTRIRFRRDGLLYEATIIPKQLALRVITRLKIMANLNIAERRLPQDGHFTLQQFGGFNVRVSTCPTLFGEKIVLRLFYNKDATLSISQLGMTDVQSNHFLQSLQQPQGLILVTGPTGSGKTITLYAALSYLNQTEKNICTVEDPIEIELPGINQVNINHRIGLNFATTLRHFLRQDPDVMMIGEIRDTETANVAIHAAQTGHLVLATLHTNSALETISRLKSFGITEHDIANTLLLIIAQRLVRKLCVNCKKINVDCTYIAMNCANCHQGYQGRTGIFEVLPMIPVVTNAICQNIDSDMLQKYFCEQRISFLKESALEKIQQGITTNIEVLRVIGCEWEQLQNDEKI